MNSMIQHKQLHAIYHTKGFQVIIERMHPTETTLVVLSSHSLRLTDMGGGGVLPYISHIGMCGFWSENTYTLYPF